MKNKASTTENNNSTTPSQTSQDTLLLSSEQLLKKLETSADGLSQTEAEKRLARYGPNEIEEKKKVLYSSFSPTSGGRYHG